MTMRGGVGSSSGKAVEAFDIMRKSGESFDAAMGKRGYVQNAGKRVILPELRSPNENIVVSD